MIKFHLIKLEKALVFQVVEMGESLRWMEPFTASNGITILSAYLPELHPAGSSIILRGRDATKDICVDLCYFPSNTKRDAYHARVLQAFKELTESRKPAAAQTQEGLYEF